MKELSVNNDPLHPKLLLELNQFISQSGQDRNEMAEAQALRTKLEEVQKLIKNKQFRETRIQVNQILSDIKGWGRSSPLDPMID